MKLTKRILGVVTSQDVMSMPGVKRTATLRVVSTLHDHHVELEAGPVRLCTPAHTDFASALRFAKLRSADLWKLTSCKDCDLEERIEQILSGE